MAEEVVIRVPGIPPGPNRLRAVHWRRRHESDRRWRSDAFWCAKASTRGLLGLPLARVAVRYVWFLPDARARDLDNLAAGCKPILDGIVDAGVIAGDSSEVIVEFGPHRVARGSRQVEVHIEPR